MLAGSNRVTQFDPSSFLGSIDLQEYEEIKIRRNISLMYTALFNFWSAAEYYKKGNQGKGISKEPDDFREKDFDKSMAMLAMSREIEYLALSRNACDHRLKNPAQNVVYGGNLKHHFSGLQIDNLRLNRSYSCFQDLIAKIKSFYNII